MTSGKGVTDEEIIAVGERTAGNDGFAEGIEKKEKRGVRCIYSWQQKRGNP